MTRSLRGVVLAALLLVASVGTAPAQGEPAQAAERAAALLAEAADRLQAAQGARDRVDALSATVRAYEEGLVALREGMRQAALRERTILLLFEAERERLARLLAVLQTIEAQPAPLLLLHPEGPLGTARAGMIVFDLAPGVAEEAAALRTQLEDLALMRRVQDDAVGELEAGLRGAQDARSALSEAIAARRDLPARFANDREAMRRLIASADSLDAFAALLRSEPSMAPRDLPSFTGARGRLRLPVLGTVLRRFEEADAAGVARPGLVLAVRPQALVTAPWPASVRYSGPFLDYGNVVILEPEADHLLILAGLGDLFVSPGDLVAGDAPLGWMPGNGGNAAELIVPEAEGGGAGLSETLYMELRQGDRPVDPAEWFAIP